MVERMSHFHSTFYSFGRGQTLNAESFRKHFLVYDPNEWAEEGGGSIQYFGDDGRVFSLVVLHNNQYGIMLSYDCYDKAKKHTSQDCYSVGNPEKLDLIKDVGDEEYFPIGSFLKLDQAWLAVEDFFKDPTQPSERILWIASDQIEWPEDRAVM